MAPPHESESEQEDSDDDAGGRDADELHARLQRLRGVIAVGHVFAIDDRVTGRTSADKRARPAVLVRVPPLLDDPTLALHQRVAVSTRSSWKPHHGPRPDRAADERRLIEQGFVFSPALSLPGFNKDGIFELRRFFPLEVAQLLGGRPLGWLLPPVVATIVAFAGSRLPDEYPPDGS